MRNRFQCKVKGIEPPWLDNAPCKITLINWTKSWKSREWGATVANLF